MKAAFFTLEIVVSEISRYLARIGRKGGRSRSPAKLAAVKANLKRAISLDASTRLAPATRTEAIGFRRLQDGVLVGILGAVCEAMLRAGQRSKDWNMKS